MLAPSGGVGAGSAAFTWCFSYTRFVRASAPARGSCQRLCAHGRFGAHGRACCANARETRAPRDTSAPGEQSARRAACTMLERDGSGAFRQHDLVAVGRWRRDEFGRVLRSGLGTRLRTRLLEPRRRLGRLRRAGSTTRCQTEESSQGCGSDPGCAYTTRHLTQVSTDFRTRHRPTLVDPTFVSRFAPGDAAFGKPGESA